MSSIFQEPTDAQHSAADAVRNLLGRSDYTPRATDTGPDPGASRMLSSGASTGNTKPERTPEQKRAAAAAILRGQIPEPWP